MKFVMNSGIFIQERNPRGKTDGIPWVFQREGTADFSSQLKEAEYRKHCSVVIDNNEGLEEMQRQIDAAVCAI